MNSHVKLQCAIFYFRVGQISNVTMNGNSYDSESATFTLEGNVLYCDFPQIGKMPGTIAVKLPVTVDETTGKITAKKDAVAGILTLKIGGTAKLYLDSLTNVITLIVCYTCNSSYRLNTCTCHSICCEEHAHSHYY